MCKTIFAAELVWGPEVDPTGLSTGKSDEEEKLRPEELNQQNIEALVAESNLVRS